MLAEPFIVMCACNALGEDFEELKKELLTREYIYGGVDQRVGRSSVRCSEVIRDSLVE